MPPDGTFCFRLLTSHLTNSSESKLYQDYTESWVRGGKHTPSSLGIQGSREPQVWEQEGEQGWVQEDTKLQFQHTWLLDQYPSIWEAWARAATPRRGGRGCQVTNGQAAFPRPHTLAVR